MIADVPESEGACHAKTNAPPDIFAVNWRGVLGGCGTVNCTDFPGPVPTEFLAETVTVYVLPCETSGIVYVVAPAPKVLEVFVPGVTHLIT